MRIPANQFGNTVARPAQGAATVPGAGAMGDALSNLGNAVGQVASDIQRRDIQEQQELDRQRKEQQRQALEMEKANAANALLDYELYSKETAASIGDQVAQGVLPYADAEKQYETAMAKAPKYKPSLQDPLISQSYERGTQRATFSGKTAVGNASRKAMYADYRGKFDAGIDKLGKLAGIPGADVAEINTRVDELRVIAEQSGMPANQIDKQLQDFKDRNWFNQASQLQNEYSNDAESLGRLKHELTAENGFYAEKIDPERRTALLRSIDGRIDQLNNRADLAANKREAKALHALDDIDKQVSSGIPAPASQWLLWQEQVKGTPYEQDFQDRVNDEREVQTLLRQPLDQQSAYIQQKRQQAAASGATIREQANLNRLERAVDANTKLLRETPLIFSQNTTGNQVQPLELGNIASPEGRTLLASQLRDRFNTVSALRRQHGPQVTQNPWLPQESAMLKGMLASANNETQLGVLSMIAQASPDGGSYVSSLKAIAADKPVLMLAGMASYRQLTTDEGRNVADTILRGDKILADKSVIMPTDNAFRASFEDMVGQAFPDGSPQRQQAFLAYKAIYAQVAADNGVRHSNEDKNAANERISRIAARIATGGIYEYNGRKVIPPYGMPEAKFKSNVDTQIQGIVKNTGYRMADVEDMPLISVPGQEGQYYLQNGNKTLADKNGKAIVVNVK